MNSSILKIGAIAVVLLLCAVFFFPAAIVIGIPGVPLMIYYAWFSPDAAFPRPWKKPF
jgi:hypothetical protein